MTQRPQRVAIVLAIGALALLYNVWTYSGVFMQPNSSSMSSTTPDLDMNVDDALSEDAESQAGLISIAPMSAMQLSALLSVLPSVERNPFEFARGIASGEIGEEGEPTLPIVQGILRGEGRRVAWINGRACSEGEEVDGHVITRIESDRIFVERAGQEFELSPVR